MARATMQLPLPFGSDSAPVSMQLSAPPTAGANQPAQQPMIKLSLVLPSLFKERTNESKLSKSVASHTEQFLTQELDVSRLNRLYKHLWLAGLPQHPRCIHKQIEAGRSIRLTERADMHLLWGYPASTIYLKPLPDFLLCDQIWAQYLCKDDRLYGSALGFLRSYILLIMYPSDLKLAIEHGLINHQITWTIWTTFVTDLVMKGITTTNEHHINPRYRYGELRLSRIDWAYRLCSGTRGNNLIRGYFSTYHSYTDFVQGHLTWLLTAFLYVAILLTAMQVGLATDQGKSSKAYKNACWLISIISAIAPIAIVLLVFFTTLFLVFLNLAHAVKNGGKPAPNDPLWQHEALSEFNH